MAQVVQMQVEPALEDALQVVGLLRPEDVSVVAEAAALLLAASQRQALPQEVQQLVEPQREVHRLAALAKRSPPVERQLQVLAAKQPAEATRLVSRTRQLQAVRAKHRVVRLVPQQATLLPVERARSLAVPALQLRERAQQPVLRVA